jgi:hypothetical protein
MANSVIPLGLEAYMSESEDKNKILSTPRLDDDFAAAATHQIRLFLLTGTTQPQAPSFLRSTSYPNTRTLALNYEELPWADVEFE